jgi:cathepsin B
MSTRKEMQREIFENGPIVASLQIYEDMYNYDSGIYEHVFGDLIGGHAMRIVGWGHDSEGNLFWIC